MVLTGLRQTSGVESLRKAILPSVSSYSTLTENRTQRNISYDCALHAPVLALSKFSTIDSSSTPRRWPTSLQLAWRHTMYSPSPRSAIGIMFVGPLLIMLNKSAILPYRMIGMIQNCIVVLYSRCVLFKVHLHYQSTMMSSSTPILVCCGWRGVAAAAGPAMAGPAGAAGPAAALSLVTEATAATSPAFAACRSSTAAGVTTAGDSTP